MTDDDEGDGGAGATVLVSACLLGHACRYDGAPAKVDARTRAALRLVDDDGRPLAVVPICPEVAGGLPTPRPPAQIEGGDGADVLSGAARVVDARGVDVTEAFRAGASAAVAAAAAHGATRACLKARSPSCGRAGVAHAALRAAGVVVTTDEDHLDGNPRGE